LYLSTTIKSKITKKTSLTSGDFSPKTAIQANKESRIHEWACDFLDSPGGNKNMAKGMRKRLKEDKLYWFGPINFPLAEFERCCGPETGMEYPEAKNKWTRRLNALRKAIRNGEKLPVVIVNPRPWPLLSVRDGNHRYEALCLENKKKYWTLFWFDDKKDKQKFKQKYKNLIH
jgi:hypothetical protein